MTMKLLPSIRERFLPCPSFHTEPTEQFYAYVYRRSNGCLDGNVSLVALDGLTNDLKWRNLQTMHEYILNLRYLLGPDPHHVREMAVAWAETNRLQIL